MELDIKRAQYTLLLIFLLILPIHILATTGFTASRLGDDQESIQLKITIHKCAKKAYWALFTGVSFAAAYTTWTRCGDECDATDTLGIGACALGGALPWVDDFFNSRIESVSKSLAALGKSVDKKEE